MLSTLVKVGGYALLFAAVSTVGQSFGFGGDSSPEASARAGERVTSVLAKVPGGSSLSGVGIPGAETATFKNVGTVLR